MKQASISKALIFAALSALLSSPHATESNLEFKINIKDEIRVFNALVGNYIIDVSLHRDDNPKLGKITVGKCGSCLPCEEHRINLKRASKGANLQCTTCHVSTGVYD